MILLKSSKQTEFALLSVSVIVEKAYSLNWYRCKLLINVLLMSTIYFLKKNQTIKSLWMDFSWVYMATLILRQWYTSSGKEPVLRIRCLDCLAEQTGKSHIYFVQLYQIILFYNLFRQLVYVLHSGIAQPSLHCQCCVQFDVNSNQTRFVRSKNIRSMCNKELRFLNKASVSWIRTVNVERMVCSWNMIQLLLVLFYQIV